MRKPDILSKWLHVGMASCIVLCTVFYLGGMDIHAKNVSLGLIFFNLHKFVGINFIVISAIYLIWSAKKHGKPMSELFPWFDAGARAKLVREVRQFRKLRDTRIASVALGICVLVGFMGVMLAVWIIAQAAMGHDLAHDALLTHAPHLLLLSLCAYFLPWLYGETRAGLAREFRRLKSFETHRIASAVQGFGVASAVLATWLGLAIVCCSIAGIKFGSEQWLPRAHLISSYAVMGYLTVHAGAAFLHGLIGHTEIFEIGKLLERTMQMPVYRPESRN